MGLFLFLIALFLMMLGGNSLAQILLYAPNLEYLGFHVLCVFVTIPASMFFMYRAFDQLEKYIYQSKDKLLKQNHYVENQNIVIRHEKHPSGKPKHLVSVFVDGQEYIADDFEEVAISSYHTGYYLKMIPGMDILVVRDNNTGKWECYQKS